MTLKKEQQSSWSGLALGLTARQLRRLRTDQNPIVWGVTEATSLSTALVCAYSPMHSPKPDSERKVGLREAIAKTHGLRAKRKQRQLASTGVGVEKVTLIGR